MPVKLEEWWGETTTTNEEINNKNEAACWGRTRDGESADRRRINKTTLVKAEAFSNTRVCWEVWIFL